MPPQILKKSGVDYMMTQKLSWNTVNFFPHHSFHWQGVRSHECAFPIPSVLADDSFSNGSRLQIDGTACLVHTLPEETYNSPAAPRALKKVEQNYREAGVSDHVLMLFGIGDGGGNTHHHSCHLGFAFKPHDCCWPRRLAGLHSSESASSNRAGRRPRRRAPRAAAARPEPCGSVPRHAGDRPRLLRQVARAVR